MKCMGLSRGLSYTLIHCDRVEPKVMKLLQRPQPLTFKVADKYHVTYSCSVLIQQYAAIC